MSSKDKEKTINKFKQFFRQTKTSGGLRERDLSPELEQELRPETPIAQRCKALKDLGDVVLTSHMENASLKKLWDLTKDLIAANKSTEYRHVTLTFYRKLIQGQYGNLTFMREHFFHVIEQHKVSEDLRHRLELLKQLTDNGKDIRFFEEKIGFFMLQWAPEIVDAGLTELYLEMLVNIVKFNAAHLENDIVVGILEHACNLSCNVDDTRIGLQCLQILDAVICYAIFPNESLALCILALCRTVNLVPYCQTAWKIMRNLLGTNSGHEALLTMCRILNDKMLYNDEVLLRGAVFHINMGIWGSNCTVVPMLRYSPSTVLISFLNSLESRKIIVTYEVILSIQMMIQKSGKDLAEHTWDVVCDILFAIADNIAYYEKNDLLKECILQRQFHETIDKIENLVQADEISINPEIMYQLIEKIAEDRPEISILKLIDYRSAKISATRPQWLQTLHAFIERFYKISNTNVRVKTVQSLIRIMDSNRAAYEEEILERVVIPQFSNIGQETNLLVRTVVAKALIDFAWHCDTKRCGELLDILEKILNRPFEVSKTDGAIFQTEADIQDVMTVVEGAIDVFMIKLYRLPSCHAIRIFHMLVGHLELHYQRPKVFENLSCLRHKIFVWILKARANGTYHIGYPDPAKPESILFSHYLGIDSSLPSHQGAVNQQQLPLQTSSEGVTQNFTTISIRRGCKTIVLCLEKEQDYSVFQLVLHELPKILQNKALIIGSDIESLASVILRIFADRKFPDNMAPKSVKLTSDDFYALMLPAIASLVTYHQYLPMRQQSIIEALKLGIPSRTAAVCINTLTVMILEIPEILMRQLPEVLLELSKMSHTVSVAMPVLEFLSILSRLPNHRFTNFVPRQYMYVFAISFPYTKPHRYNHYTVSLAHHVIAGWFLKCRLIVRRNIVSYIIASIQSNFEDVKVPQTSTMPYPVNEDSSNRKRSASLTERGSRGRDCPTINPQPPNSDLRPKMNEHLKTFHMELAETCMDFIARHTFSPCSALPKRLPSAEYLLKDAPSQTWLVGTNLITITTSGCSALPTRNGLCDRCAQVCCATSQNLQKIDTSTPNSSYTPNSPEVIGGVGSSQRSGDGPPDFSANKRYTKASLQASSGTESGSMDLTSSTSSSSQHNTHQSIDKSRQISNEGRFSCSSGSLEALSRRGSNPDPGESRESVQLQQQICACSCTGWAEVYIRRPTGCISWMMRIQNPVENDCLGNDMPVHDLIGLFLPSQHGGVFGPEFLKDLPPMSPPTVSLPKSMLDPKETSVILAPIELKESSDEPEQEAVKTVAKVRALKRQEEISTSISSGPIDIPKKLTQHKEPAGSFSDVDDDDNDDDDVSFEDGDSRSRNPVRRVNSSPEMSSNWRNPHLTAKQGGKMPVENIPTTTVAGDNSSGLMISSQSSEKDDDGDQQQKKKNFGKDMRVSCEAIPEEIAGSTPPSQSESLQGNQEQSGGKPEKEKDQSSSTSVLPPKQHSADDVTQTLAVAISTSTTSLKIPIDLQKVTAKPPQSPAPLSPHPKARNAADRIARQMTSFASNTNDGGSGGSDSNGGNGGGGGDMPRGRSKTISVVREVNRVNRNTSTNRSATNFRQHTSNPSSISRLGISPNFIFLQLYYTGQLQVTDQPIKVNPENMKAITLLDFIPPFETHKIGVLYVGPGQCNSETEILRNRFGSVRYVEFLRNLGTLVSLKDAKEHNLFVNMETSGRDGNFTYVWKDEIVQVTFHVATLMPNKEKDPNCNEKKKHIGNDFVSIVYNESGEEYSLNTIKGQFNYACVVVQPLELNSNRIFIRAKDEIAEYISHSEPKIVSDSSAPLLARQLALHANLASLVSQSLKTKSPYASNWLERLRKIKNLRTKLLKESQAAGLGTESNSADATAAQSADVSTKMPRPNINDFTKYT